MTVIANASPAVDLADRIQRVLDLYSSVTKTPVPVHNEGAAALWVWLDDEDEIRHERAHESPNPKAVVASWHVGSRRTIAKPDFVDAVVMELQERQ